MRTSLLLALLLLPAAGGEPDAAGRAMAWLERNVPKASLSSRLGVGERTCLAVACEHHGLLVSDDLDARLSAQRLGLEITGTLWVLVLSVKRKLLSRQAANDALTAMIASGYRSPLDRLDLLL